MSPNLGGSDSEDVRRAVSPPGRMNGTTQSVYGAAGKVKPATRQDPDSQEPQALRERTLSDAQTSREQPQAMAVRSKSPQGPASRAISPSDAYVVGDTFAAQPPNIASVVNGISVNGRSSPQVARQNPPTDAFYSAPQPTANNHARSTSRVGGSVSHTNSDAARELRSKDSEIEGLKRQMTWMREALANASRSGYVHKPREEDVEEALSSDTSELALKFKKFRAQMQVGHGVSTLCDPSNTCTVCRD